jgi:hypothetical protein
MTRKKCFKCKRIKSIDDFYVHKQMGDGHLGKCKTCTKRDVATRYLDPLFRPRILAYERARFRDPERKAKVRVYAERMRRRNRGKANARRKFTYAIRTGRITRKLCEVCGSEKAQGHHTDYRKPLVVRWLCFRHHREAHGQHVA